MNTETVKTIAHSSPAAEALFKKLSSLKRMRRKTNISRWTTQVLQDEECTPQDFQATFEKMEKVGLGRIVSGRSGKRFIWNYDSTDVAKAADNDKVVLEAIEGKKLPASKKTKRPKKIKRVSKPLGRPKRILTLSAPLTIPVKVDLKSPEVKKIIKERLNLIMDGFETKLLKALEEAV